MQAGDVYLDSFPYSGPTSTSEALSLGIAVVALSMPLFRGRLAAGILSEIGLSQLVANDIEEYAAIACRLATDLGFRAAVKTEIQKNFPVAPYFDKKGIACQLDLLFDKLTAVPDP
jgi:predicted O-linked N-acetylglucosamine transferase (SPINDLY family)